MLVTAPHSSRALSPQLSDNHGDLECRYPGHWAGRLSLGPGPRGLLSTTIATQPGPRPLINGLAREREEVNAECNSRFLTNI